MDGDLGRVLAGRYRLIAALGQGGMGAVWRALDEHLGREVAVKALHLPDRLTVAERENWIARLDREARAAARLKHPGIVTVHDHIADEDGRPWIVMELVHGSSLDDVIRSEGRLPAGRAARIGLQVLAALRTAHQAGVTHRDIKPANILLEQDRVVLTDFGIAALEGDVTLTASGMIMGTPAFMAPEQVRGLPATAASDLWSLGATLYTAVEGRPPFTGTTPSAVLVSVATEDPAPAMHAGHLGPALSGLLHRDPAERLSHDRLQEFLTRCGDDEPSRAESVPAVPPARPPAADPAAVRDTPEVAVHDAPTAAVRHAPPAPAHGAPAPPVPPGPPRTPTVANRPSRGWRRAWTRAIVVAAVLALLTGAGYLLYDWAGPGRTNPTYEANLRSAEEMGAPDGFRRTAEEELDGGRVRLTYAAPTADCDDGCRDQLESVNLWLTRQPGVGALRPPKAGFTAQGCYAPGDCRLAITPYGKPPLSNGQWYIEADLLLFEVDLG